MNKQNLQLVPEESTAQKVESEFLQQQVNQKVEELSQPTNISAGRIEPEDKKELKRILFHTANAFSMGSVGTFFHLLGAPSEVGIIILIIDVIYIMRFLVK